MKQIAWVVGTVAISIAGASVFGDTLQAGSKGAVGGDEIVIAQAEKQAAPAAATKKPTAKPLPSIEEAMQIGENDVIYGDASAPVTILEYASLSCSHCASFHQDILPAIDEKYIKTGKAKLVFRNFPHNAPGFRGAMLLKCVDESQYYTFAKVLFSMQDKWAFSNGFMDDLKKIAAVGGVDDATFDQCMANKDIETDVLEVRRIGADVMDVQATPTIFVDGEKMQGSGNAGVFLDAIEKAYNKKKSAE